jgi:hypothetical protein
MAGVAGTRPVRDVVFSPRKKSRTNVTYVTDVTGIEEFQKVIDQKSSDVGFLTSLHNVTAKAGQTQ